MLSGRYCGANDREELFNFLETAKDGSPGFLAQWCSNKHGHFLVLEDYGGGNQRGFIIISERRYDKGWRSLALELRVILNFFSLSVHGGGSIILTLEIKATTKNEGKINIPIKK